MIGKAAEYILEGVKFKGCKALLSELVCLRVRLVRVGAEA